MGSDQQLIARPRQLRLECEPLSERAGKRRTRPVGARIYRFSNEQPLQGRARSQSVVKTDSLEPCTPELACSY
eukprot:4827223-Pleurochrysis_carterae.AAC.6